MPHASRSYDSATLAEALRIIDTALAVMDAREATGEYYMEETLLKRVTAGSSVAGTCEECDENIEAGWIDSEDVYPSGDDGPEFHPGCVCEEEYKESRKRVYV